MGFTQLAIVSTDNLEQLYASWYSHYDQVHYYIFHDKF